MKLNASLLSAAAGLLASLVVIPSSTRINAQNLDPKTGLPVSPAGTLHFPVTGLPGSESTNSMAAGQAVPLDAQAQAALDYTARTNWSAIMTLSGLGRYEEALQFCLTFQGQTNTELAAQQVFGVWAELGRHYAPAEQALRKIRDDVTRQLTENGGSLLLFGEVDCLNRNLGEEAATCTLFKQIWKQNPALAGYYYPLVEHLLITNGECALCQNCMGDPQGRYASYRRNLDTFRQVQRQIEEREKENPRPSWYPPMPELPNSAEAATNGFVDAVCKLVEVLVATGNRAGAENIRAQAVAHGGDNLRLAMAMKAAAENIQRHGTVPLLAVDVPPYDGDHSRGEFGLMLANGLLLKDLPGLPLYAQLPAWIARGQYDEALGSILKSVGNLPSFPNVGLVLPDWSDLARIYPPAKKAMIEIRDRGISEFIEATERTPLIFGLFTTVSQLNNALGETNATYQMCQNLQRHNPAQFDRCFDLMESIFMEHGDYQLCLKNIGDPQANFESLHTSLESSRKDLPRWQELQTRIRKQQVERDQKFEQTQDEQLRQNWEEKDGQMKQFRQANWDRLRTNTLDADEMAVTPPPNFQPMLLTAPPALNRELPPPYDVGLPTTNAFVGRICMLVNVLVANGRMADAVKIRDEAVAVLDDPRLESAVADAERKFVK